ncbi:MAG: hypothetical protein JWM42_2264, partial [Burkholderia sp.]|nr:hypothetical protein [Burkholderia sp.]
MSHHVLSRVVGATAHAPDPITLTISLPLII